MKTICNLRIFEFLSRRAINRVKSITERTYYRKAIYANCGLKQCYCLYENNPKNINKENTKSKYRVEMATDALILFTKVGYYAAIIMTFLMAVILIGVLIYAIALKIVSNQCLDGLRQFVSWRFAFWAFLLCLQ